MVFLGQVLNRSSCVIPDSTMKIQQWLSSHLIARNYSSLVDMCTAIFKKYRKKPYQRDRPMARPLWQVRVRSLNPTIPHDSGIGAAWDMRRHAVRDEQHRRGEEEGRTPQPWLSGGVRLGAGAQRVSPTTSTQTAPGNPRAV